MGLPNVSAQIVIEANINKIIGGDRDCLKCWLKLLLKPTRIRLLIIIFDRLMNQLKKMAASLILV